MAAGRGDSVDLVPSVMAIVSKAVFEQQARGIALGDVWATARYASHNKGLAALAEGGDLFLVTVRAPEQLWIVARLIAPRFSKGEWHAKANVLPARSLEDIRGDLRFVSGTGITAKPGALGMSLQTPRVLTTEDVALLEAPCAKPKARPKKGASKAWRTYIERHARRAEKLRAALPEAVALPARAAKQAAACLVALAKPDGPKVDLSERALLAQAERATKPPARHAELDQLLAAIYETPDDDQVRAVYADALQQRGDPRGELIALQLVRAQTGKAATSRERELLKLHLRTWLAPLDNSTKSPRFARGFLDAAIVEWLDDNERAKLLEHPMWSTVRELDTADQDLLLRPQLRALRRATTDAATLAQLAKRAHPVPLEAAIGRLTMSYGIRARYGIELEDEATWGAALHIGALTSLRSLSINGRQPTPATMRWLLDSELADQLAELDVQCVRFAVRPWLDHMREMRDGVVVRGTFSNANTAAGRSNPQMSIELVRRGDNFTAMIECNNDFSQIRHMSIGGQVRTALEGLAIYPISATVRYTGSKKRGKQGFPAIAADLRAAFSDLTLL